MGAAGVEGKVGGWRSRDSSEEEGIRRGEREEGAASSAYRWEAAISNHPYEVSEHA